MSFVRACAILAFLFSAAAHAHSASDAYLTLSAGKPAANAAVVIDGQWDIALRDLQFALKLDDDGDGNLTWAEVRRHEQRIARYAFDHLRATADGKPCAVEPARNAVTDHADGAYLALLFRMACSGAPRRVALDYRLFFAIDPSHRGIVVFRAGNAAATSLMSPEKTRIELVLPR